MSFRDDASRAETYAMKSSFGSQSLSNLASGRANSFGRKSIQSSFLYENRNHAAVPGPGEYDSRLKPQSPQHSFHSPNERRARSAPLPGRPLYAPPPASPGPARYVLKARAASPTHTFPRGRPVGSPDAWKAQLPNCYERTMQHPTRERAPQHSFLKGERKVDARGWSREKLCPLI